MRGGPRSAPTVAQAAGERRRGPAPLGLRGRGSRAGLAPGASVAGSPGTRRCAGEGARARGRSVGRPPGGGLAGHVPAAAGPQEPARDEARARPCKARESGFGSLDCQPLFLLISCSFFKKLLTAYCTPVLKPLSPESIRFKF